MKDHGKDIVAKGMAIPAAKRSRPGRRPKGGTVGSVRRAFQWLNFCLRVARAVGFVEEPSEAWMVYQALRKSR